MSLVQARYTNDSTNARRFRKLGRQSAYAPEGGMEIARDSDPSPSHPILCEG